MADHPGHARAMAPISRRLLAATSFASALLLGMTACGRSPGPVEAPIPDDIAFPAEERRLLMTDTPPAAPSGPVSRENYLRQLEALEAELLREEGWSAGIGSSLGVAMGYTIPGGMS